MTVERHDALGGADTRHSDPWWGVHAARYVYAQELARDRRALDVACGSGYGLPILAATARAVVGVDGSLDAARQARALFANPAPGTRNPEPRRNPAPRTRNPEPLVVVSDACRLPFADRSWELVTSFETIEHLRDRTGFVTELRRVLTDRGTCIVSTPNAKYTRPVDGKPRNPFHVHEYEPAELVAELSGQFQSVELLGQRLSRRFTVSPFWDDQQRMPRAIGAQARLLAWRLLSRAPAVLGNGASVALWGHRLIPTELDYDFTADGLDEAPVLVAICR